MMDPDLPAGHLSLPRHCVKTFEDWREFLACLLPCFSPHPSHKSFTIPTSFFSSPILLVHTWQERWSEVRSSRGSSIPQGWVAAPLILHSRYDHWRYLAAPPQKTFRVIPLNSSCANLADLYLLTEKKKQGPKDQKKKKNALCLKMQQNPFSWLLMRSFTTKRWNSSALPPVCVLFGLRFPREAEGEPEFPFCVRLIAFKQMLDRLQPNQPHF